MAITDEQKERINRAMPANRGVDLGGIIQTLQGRVAENQAASTAADVTELVADFNALLTKLKAAGLMEADS